MRGFGGRLRSGATRRWSSPCGGLASRPRGDVIEPAAVEERHYFRGAQLERARDFRVRPAAAARRAIGAGGSRARRPRTGRPAAAVRSRRARPADAGGAAAAGIALVLVVVTLPLEAIPTSAPSTSGCRRRTGAPGWLTWPRRPASAPSSRPAGRRSRSRSGAGSAGRWWIPASVASSRSAACSPALAPLVLDAALQRLRGAAAGRLARRARAGRARRGGHRRGLPGRREPPHDGAERLRRTGSGRPSAWCSTTT